ncbi:MAG: hypothetical protein WC565_09070 [Parcubacteria group bacterium]|jgi:hypothetical protein
MAEGYKPIGKSGRNFMKKLWRESGTKLSLKQWAAQQPIGEIAHVWINFKRRPRASV